MSAIARAFLVLIATALTAATAGEAWTARFEDELATQEWTLIKSAARPGWQPLGWSNAIPVGLSLTDSASGKRAPLEPSAYFTSEDRQRWGGRTLGVDWVLVVDGATGATATVSGQLKSGMPRVLQLEAEVAQPGIELTSDADQPRIHERTTSPESGGPGLRYFLKLDPATYGGRATLRFNLTTALMGPPTNHSAAAPIESEGWAGEDPELKSTLAALIRARAGGTQNTPLPGLRRNDEPVFAAVEQRTVISIEEETAVEVILHNLTDQPQPVVISGYGDFAVPTVSLELPPEASRVEWLPVHSMEPATGTVSVVVEAGGFRCLDIPIPVNFLPPQDNLARDSRVKVEVDSTLSGYRTTALTDGVNPAGDQSEERVFTWASDESVAAHWVRMTLPQPTAISEMRLVWHQENGRPLTSQRGEITGWTATGERIALASVDRPGEEAETVIEFEGVQLHAIEWRQPSGGGAPRRPNLLWLNELEVR